MRFYPSLRTADDNVLLTPSDGIPTRYFDTFDILTGLAAPETVGGYAHTLYSSTLIDDTTSGSVSVVIPIWFNDVYVDDEDFKLRSFNGESPRIYDPDNPGDRSMMRNGSFGVGAYNYRCVVKILPAEDGWQVAYIQGYINRGSQLHLHVDLQSTDSGFVENPTCIDPDGDGWGWDGTVSCRVDQSVCLDTDGDGWGWDGQASCIP